MEELYYRLIEVQFSILNVFHSKFSTKQISDESEVSYTAVNELRNGKREISNASLDIINKLYNFAIKNNLTKIQIDTKAKKGHYSTAHFELPVKEVWVSFERYDLFAHGLFLINNPEDMKDSNKLVSLDVANTIVVTGSERKKIDANTLGEQFQCRYGGHGPNNYVRFLKKYSAIPDEKIREIVFSNSVVKYDFEKDELEVFDSIFNDSSSMMRIRSFNEKLIFLLGAREFHGLFTFQKTNSEELDKIIDTMNYIRYIMKTYYHSEDMLVNVKYVSNFTTPETQKYIDGQLVGLEEPYHIILSFKDYEIWINYPIHPQDKPLWKSKEMQQIISQFSNVSAQYPEPEKIKFDLFNKKEKPAIEMLSFK